jgi:hypothetical protein
MGMILNVQFFFNFLYITNKPIFKDHFFKQYRLRDNEFLQKKIKQRRLRDNEFLLKKICFSSFCFKKKMNKKSNPHSDKG